MSTIARSYKYRLYPTPAQEQMLTNWQIACWEVQRACVLQRRYAWERYKISRIGTLPNQYSQGREITEARRELPHLADVPADTLTFIVQRVQAAYDRAIENLKKDREQFQTNPAEFLRRHGEPPRFHAPRWNRRPTDVGLTFRGQPERGTRLVHDQGRFAWWRLASAGKLGALKVRMHRPIPAGVDVRQAHIVREADGWYISFSCTIPAPQSMPAQGKPVIGVDLNVKHDGDRQEIAAVDDGRKYRITDNYKRSLSRLKTLQKLVSHNRRTKGGAKPADPKSKRTARRQAKIARLHQRIARQRGHVQQYVARRLVDTASIIAFERLNHQAMRRKGKGRRKRGLNRALANAAPGNLIRLTEEKAAITGRRVVKVDARHTTQACSACGAIGERKDLNVRRWACAACGASHDRDVNAAKNIKARAMRTLDGVEPVCDGGLRGEEGAPRRKCPSANREDRKRSGGETVRRRSTLSRDYRQLAFDFAPG